MKWQLPWKRQVNDQDVMAYDDREHHVHAAGAQATPFVEPFRPLYDITDANNKENYTVPPLYTPSSFSSHHSQTGRISAATNSYYPRNRTVRPGSDRFPYRNGRRSYSGRSGEEEHQSSIITYQWIGAIVLVGVLYLAFHNTSPLAERIQSQVTTAMQTDADISRLSAWVHDHLHQQSEAVPASTQPNQDDVTNAKQNPNSAGTSQLSPSTVQTQQADTSDPSVQSKIGGANSAYTVPLKNAKISSDYKKDTQQEMILTGQPGEAVQAVAAGVVAAVDHTQQQGTYVLIDHGSSGKTLYAHLGAVSVQLNAKVTQGQTIGTLEKDGKTADMYFGYIKDGKYENPHSIVPFQ